MSYIVAADTGGTFTDLAVYDTNQKSVRYAKSLTTYDDLVRSVMDCTVKADLKLAAAQIVKLGTTLAINTFVMRTGARTALITTEGFRDVLELRRGNRAIPFDLRYQRNAPLAPRDLRFEVTERIASDGSVLTPLDTIQLRRLGAQLRTLNVEAVAISFMNSYVNDAHEQEATEILREMLPEIYVTAGTEITREWYEFERTSTAVANAYVGPRLKNYVTSVANRLKAEDFNRNFFLMASNGGVFSRQRSEMQPVMLVESGPVGGCIGAGVYAKALELKKVIAFDMGGTTAKCAIIEDGKFEVKSPYYIDGAEHGFPIRGGVLDIVEVGAGGGSIASLDEHQRLGVGPRSAGSKPGPVAYRRGGTEPTITDANLVLGRIDAGQFLNGEMTLDLAGAKAALRDKIAIPLGYDREVGLEEVAHGIIQLGTMTMANAIKRITIERGLDPRDFSLFVFGGGGPLHGATLAREMNIPEVIVPPYPGIFSALGMLLADARIDETRPFLQPMSAGAIAELDREFTALEAATAVALAEEVGSNDITFIRQVDMRYRGQKHSIRAELGSAPTEQSTREAFEEAYLRRYGHVYTSGPIEFVSLVLTAVARITGPEPEQLRPALSEAAPEPKGERKIYFAELEDFVATPVYDRSALPIGFTSAGPAAIEEYGSTTIVGPNDLFAVGSLGEIRIRFN